MEKLEVLTLDFDGCLHSVEDIADLAGGVPLGVNLLDEVGRRGLMRWWPLLHDLLDRRPNLMLMVHSGWRNFLSDGQIRKLLTPYEDRFLGTTPRGPRWRSIMECVERFDIGNVVIIDDAVNEFPPGLECLVACHPYVGVSDPAVLARIEQVLVQGHGMRERWQ